MTRKPKTEFERLKDEWYKKLKESGFEDIESDETRLKKWSSQFGRMDHSVIQIRESYYQMATRFFNEHNFDTDLDKVIWLYHSEGIGSREIVDTLAKVNIQTSHTIICRIISCLERIMKTKYLPGYKEENE